MKRASKISTLKGIIKKSELHTIPLKKNNFNRMKKIYLTLSFICICTQMLFSNNIENGEPTQLKKGDWFTIEFDSHPEDYSTPQDSVDYHSLLGLKKLAFKCEVSAINDKLIKLNFKFERLFVVNEYGEYFDSYFSQDATYKSDDFQIEAAINLTNDSINFISADKDFDRYTYATFSREVDIQGNRVSTTESSRSIPLIIMKSLLDTYLKNWQRNDYQTPLKSSGDIKVADFSTYRILESNLQIMPNFHLYVNIEKGLLGEKFSIYETKLAGYGPFEVTRILDSEITGENNNLSFYLPEQKILSFIYNSERIEFVATPNDSLHLNINLNSQESKNIISSKYQGDQHVLSVVSKEFKSPGAFPNDLYHIYSADSAIQFMNEQLNQNLKLVNSFKSQLTATFYRQVLMSLYYINATQTLYWYDHRKEQPKYSDLSHSVAFQNIHPIYDYIVKPAYYDYYTRNVTYNKFNPGYESVSTNQGFTRNFDTVEDYDMYDILYWGYPKYFILKENIRAQLEHNGIKSTKENYDKFLANCKYPPFLSEIKSYYEEIKEIEPGASIFDLPLNFTNHKNYKRNSGKYKIVAFPGQRSSLEKKKLVENISAVVEKLNLEDKLEMIVLSDNESNPSSSDEDFPASDNFETLHVDYQSMSKVWEDRNTLKMYFQSLLIISPDNIIISRNNNGWNIIEIISEYIEAQNQPKSHENRKAMILGAFISLLGTGLLAWLIIKINNRRIKKRESARRKLSELELKAIRSQMNPHFIFNAMGSIQNLMNHGKTEKANLYLSSFARLMRMVLSSSNKKLVSLSDELELIRLYLELEQLRVDFKFKFDVKEDVDPETEEIPGMLLQPFVENAVIHGITPKGEGIIEVDISKSETDLVCSISDDGVGIDPAKTGNGNGLAMKFAEKRINLLSEQLKTRMKLKVENRSVSEGKSGTKVTLIIPVE